MRVLLCCVPGFGHFHPMVPAALALRAAGHEVAFATAERFCRNVIEPAGFLAFPAGLSPLDVQDRLAQQDPAAGNEAAADDEAQQARFGAAMFAGVAGPAKVGDLTAVIRDWAPSLLVHDPVDFGAPLAAAAAGLPYAAHSVGALQPVEFWEPAWELLRPLWPRSRWSQPGTGGWSRLFPQLYLDTCPPSLQSPHITDVAAARRLRPVLFDTTGTDRLPAWVGELGPAPTVYVTLGTVFNTTPGLFETILAALAHEPVNVVVTVGLDRDPAQLGTQPGNVHVQRYLPQSLLLPHCDVVVAHGGSGTTFAALAHGLPSLLLPQGADQLGNARRIAECGAGTVLRDAEATPAAVRGAVRGLLSRRSYRTQARRLQQEIREMPGPERAVELLEELVGITSPVASGGSWPTPDPPRAG
ncbi:MAG: glycosyltransferase [Pseudonocardiaceae bacterium]|nr:glycosyltransferase [Pseudonocardiaceae bacterium]